MILRGIDFGSVFAASGARSFFPEVGYWYHRPAAWLGWNFRGTTFIAKTTTLHERTGNMPRRDDAVTPRDWKPHCIKVYLRRATMLNAVGLSGPGAAWLLKQGRWQRYTEPFLLSFMTVANTLERRLAECADFVRLLKRHLPDFAAPVGLQVNLSCPNVGLSAGDLASEADGMFTILADLGIPLVVKVCATLPVETAVYISRHTDCDGISVSNAIPWGELPDRIDWVGLFGTDVSPLTQYGGGALSGAPLFPITREWVGRARQAGLTKPIMAGGGVQTPKHAEELLRIGATAIELGTVFLLRPWRARWIVKRVRAVIEERVTSDIPVSGVF